MNSFTSDIRPETYPRCGFAGNWNGEEGDLYNTSVVTDEPSPDGKPFLRTAFIPGADTHGGGRQFYIGFGNDGIGMAPVQGMEIFLRWIFRARHHYPGGGGLGVFASSSKLILLGDAGGHEGESRVISQFRDDGNTAESSAVMLTRNIEGGPKAVVADSEWHCYQAAIKSSSREGANDARLRLWVDNMDVNAPAIDTQGETLSVIDWASSLKYGGYLGFEGAPPGVWDPAPILDLGSFQVGDAFDAGWGTGSAIEPPKPVEPGPAVCPTCGRPV
jgi:hypothetical protein